MKLILKITLLSMVILLIACQKENTSKAGSMSEANRAKLERLDYFDQVLRKHHENPQVEARSSETFSPGETRWALESVINIYHTLRPDQFENLIISQRTIEIPLTNNAITEDNFYNAYISLYDSLVVAFNAATIPNKHFVGIVINNDTIMSDKVRYKVYTQFASSVTSINDCSEMFDNDYYIGVYQNCSDSNLSGSCDGIDESNNGICLMRSYLNELIQEDLNDANPDPQNFPWFGGFIGDEVDFVDAVAFLSYPNPDFDHSVDDPINEYLMIRIFNDDLQNVNGGLDYCISEENLNWFLCNHYDIATSYPLQSGYHLAMVNLELTQVTSGGNFAHGSSLDFYKGVPFFTNLRPGGGIYIGNALPPESLLHSVIMP